MHYEMHNKSLLGPLMVYLLFSSLWIYGFTTCVTRNRLIDNFSSLAFLVFAEVKPISLASSGIIFSKFCDISQ